MTRGGEELKIGRSGRTGSGFARLFAFIERANRVARERRALMRLDDIALKDFGASRADALNEGAKPWWDLPVPSGRDREAA